MTEAAITSTAACGARWEALPPCGGARAGPGDARGGEADGPPDAAANGVVSRRIACSM